MNEVKIVIGANYGDEGKGLMTRCFCVDAKAKGMRPIVIFHNGTAQRGHTVDYDDKHRHVYHHFGSGTGDCIPTYFAETFLVHPMTFHKEYVELIANHYASQKYFPYIYCNPKCPIVTPFDVAVDLATNDYIAAMNGKREFGSCCYGSWCTTNRIAYINYTIADFSDSPETYAYIMETIMKACLAELASRNVDIDRIPQYKDYFNVKSERYKTLVANFNNDLCFFNKHVKLCSYDEIWKEYDCHVFENGQGLGLDKDISNDWHTTSKTGLHNPYRMLKNRKEYNAEVCYVTRSYLTRHGVGPLEEEAEKEEINAAIVDKTNVFNMGQGDLRYGYIEDNNQKTRIAKDWNDVSSDSRFRKTIAVTHCNELRIDNMFGDYYSDNPFTVNKRR